MKKFRYTKIKMPDYYDAQDIKRTLNEYGEKGWELMEREGDTFFFKRTIEEPQKTYYSEIEETIGVLSTGFVALGKEFSSLQAKENIIIGLLQELAEKFCPDSKILQSLKAQMEVDSNPDFKVNLSTPSESAPEIKEDITKNETDLSFDSSVREIETADAKGNETPETQETENTEETVSQKDTESLIDEYTLGFADQHIEHVMKDYQHEDKSPFLFSIMCGFGGILPQQSIQSHCEHMVKALYRYYEKNSSDKKIKECFENALSNCASYLSSPATIDLFNEISDSAVTVEEASDIFFSIVSAQLQQEKNGTAPFTIDETADHIKSYMDEIKTNSDTCDNEELISKTEEHLKSLRENFGLELSF